MWHKEECLLETHLVGSHLTILIKEGKSFWITDCDFNKGPDDGTTTKWDAQYGYDKLTYNLQRQTTQNLLERDLHMKEKS